MESTTWAARSSSIRDAPVAEFLYRRIFPKPDITLIPDRFYLGTCGTFH